MTMKSEDREAFVPAEDFLGFPPGAGRRGMNFRKGVETEPLPSKFVELMRQKGLALEKKPAAKPSATDAPVS